MDEAKIRVSTHACTCQYISMIDPMELQAVLKDTLPNIISIAWQSHAGEDHLQVPCIAICAREALAAAPCPLATNPFSVPHYLSLVLIGVHQGNPSAIDACYTLLVPRWNSRSSKLSNTIKRNSFPLPKKRVKAR